MILAVTVENDTPNRTDGEIVGQVLSGNVNAFEGLVERYERLVLSIVRNHVPLDEIEDTMQEVFLRAYRSLPTFKGDNGFRPWLSVIAARTCSDFWRERYRSREFPISSLTEEHQQWLERAALDRSAQAFHERGIEREGREVLEWAMDRLSPTDRMALELVYLEGRPVKEAAALMGLSTANVKIRLFRSRRKLHALFSAETKERREET